jgi:hypothetical protein
MWKTSYPAIVVCIFNLEFMSAMKSSNDTFCLNVLTANSLKLLWQNEWIVWIIIFIELSYVYHEILVKKRLSYSGNVMRISDKRFMYSSNMCLINSKSHSVS